MVQVFAVWSALLVGALLTAWPASANSAPPVFPADRPGPPGSLKAVPPPLPPNLSDFVADKQAAVVLGKALFWDEQAGSDGLACASCHFHAGADNRVKNELSPGLRNEQGAPIAETFNVTASNRTLAGAPPGGGPNYTLKKADFPVHQLADPNDRESAVLFDTDKANLLAFLKALTDDRVRWEQAPFDHPELHLPNVAKGDQNRVNRDGSTGRAQDEVIVLPAIGACGRTAKNLPPLAPFEAGLK